MITYDYDETTGCISVLAHTAAGTHREALVPGEFDRARELLPDDLYAELEALWTPEVIEAWEEANAEPKPLPLTLEQLRTAKLAEVNSAATETIYTGIDVETSKGYKHFTLKERDQIFLLGLSATLEKLESAGTVDTEVIPWNDADGTCYLWNARDFRVIFNTCQAHILANKTYASKMYKWIRREEYQETLSGITFGTPLPEDLATEVNEILDAAMSISV